MACSIGITTRPKEREKEWRSQYPNLKWQILETYDAKSKAQKAEKEFSTEYGCTTHPSGAGTEHQTWYVYRFTYY